MIMMNDIKLIPIALSYIIRNLNVNLNVISYLLLLIVPFIDLILILKMFLSIPYENKVKSPE